MTTFKPKIASYRHQRRFVQWLWTKTQQNGVGSKGGAAFFDPGTGKTKTAYDFISAGFLHRGLRRVLVLCPINALQVWDAQADEHILDEITFRIILPEGAIADKAKEVYHWAKNARDSELTIIALNFAAIIKRDKPWEIMKAIEAYDPDIVVVDESHHIKGATTKQTKATHRICGRAREVLLLTGTPIGKNYLDLYSQLKAIDPDIWKADWTKTGRMSWTEYRTHFAIWGGRTGYELKGYINLSELRDRYSPHIRTARKESILDMPKVTDSVIPVELNPDAHRVYRVLAEEGMVVHKRHLIEAPIPLTKLLRLQQITGGWVHDEHGEVVEIHRQKLEVLGDTLKDFHESGQSVIVFARFKAEMDAIYSLARNIYKEPFTHQIRGGVTASSRTKIVKDFQKGTRLLVIQIAAAEALDGLQNSCSYGIFYSTDYSLVHWNQARGRLDRVGQKRPVNFYHLQAKGTVDSLILQALRDKKDIERLIMDNPEVLLAR